MATFGIERKVSLSQWEKQSTYTFDYPVYQQVRALPGVSRDVLGIMLFVSGGGPEKTIGSVERFILGNSPDIEALK